MQSREIFLRDDPTEKLDALAMGIPPTLKNGEVGKCGFVGEIHVAPQTSGSTSGTVNFSTDAKQSCLYVADLGNDVVYVINRENLPS